MINIFTSENLKYKRTFTVKLILLVPLFFIIIALPQKLLMPPNYFRPWQLLISQVYNYWTVIFIPIGFSLFAALVGTQEKKAGNYNSLRTRNVSPVKLWIGKVAVMAFYSLMASIVLIGAVVIAGIITAKGEIPWFQIFAGSIVSWIVSLVLIPIQLFVSTWKGPLLSMALGFVGFIVGVVAGTKPYWICVPWSFETRLMSPIIGVHPNGTLLEANDALLNPSVIMTGIILSIVIFSITLILTSIWFSRREMHS